MTTIDTVTGHQIRTLRAEADAAGDRKQVALCDQALAHWADETADAATSEAIAACVDTIREAEQNKLLSTVRKDAVGRPLTAHIPATSVRVGDLLRQTNMAGGTTGWAKATDTWQPLHPGDAKKGESLTAKGGIQCGAQWHGVARHEQVEIALF